MKNSLNTLLSWTRRVGLALAVCGLLPDRAAAGQPGSDIRSASHMVYGLPGGGMPDLPRVPNFLDLADYVARNPETVKKAAKLGLKGADGVADGLEAIQDSTPYIPVDAVMGVIDKLGEGIEEALKRGDDIGEILDKYKDKIKGAGDKIKILSTALKVIKGVHLSGHALKDLYDGNRSKFAKSLNELIKETWKFGGDAAGGAVGTAGGAYLGGLVGGFFGGVGAIPGAIIGGAIGGYLGGKGGEWAAENWGHENVSKKWGKGISDWWFGTGKKPPSLPPPMPGGGGASWGGGGKKGPRPAPKLNSF